MSASVAQGSHKKHIQTSQNFMYVLTVAVSRSCFDNNAMQFVVCFCRLLSDLSPLVVELHLPTTGAVQALCIVHIYQVNQKKNPPYDFC